MAAAAQIITLLTDFGTTDAYAGIVKGILLGRAPEARIVDLVHAAEFGSLHATGYLLASAFSYFPAGTVHLVLTDPSSAPGRRIIAADVAGQYVVAPDNGIVGPLFDQHRPSALVTVQDSRLLLEPRRHTFHSRLIYAPAAAALVNGARLDGLGAPTSTWTQLPHALGTVEGDGNIVGEVVHIDHFGNLVTNIDASQLPPHPRITVGSTAIDRVSDAYGDVEPGGVLAIVGSTGKLEISINRGSAAKKLFVSRTDPVRIEAGAAEL
ncbi:MAG: SAM-dependent chlorinase/fluorinase [Acidobacteria bacterium]|nr:SAM-dependent chlorinase/fluorinase [Acidobacteriota bacterium]